MGNCCSSVTAQGTGGEGQRKGDRPLGATRVTGHGVEGSGVSQGEQGAQNTQGHGRGNPCGHGNTQGHGTHRNTGIHMDKEHRHVNIHMDVRTSIHAYRVILLKGFIDSCREIPRAPRGSGGLSRDDHLLMLLEGDRIQVSPPVPGLKGRAQIVTPLSPGT